MHFDFPTILFLAALLTGLVWGLDVWVFRPRRAERAQREGMEGPTKEPVLVEYARSFFPIIIIVLILRSFLVEPFRIPSASMMPTLRNGDFILVNKFAYGIRLPVINKKIIGVGKPERGDVVVFRFPKDPSIDYIKRIIGLPGDQIEYRDNIVYVNGKALHYDYKGRFVGDGVASSMSGARLFTEQIGEEAHKILLEPRNFMPHYDCMSDDQFIVPEGRYFVMGDNRDRSNDSRFWCGVPDENLVGKAFMIWMNWDPVANSVTWSRIGDTIQ